MEGIVKRVLAAELVLLTLISSTGYSFAEKQAMPAQPPAASAQREAQLPHAVIRAIPKESDTAPRMRISDAPLENNAVVFIIRRKNRPAEPEKAAIPAPAELFDRPVAVSATQQKTDAMAHLTEAELAAQLKQQQIAEEIRIFNEAYANDRTEQINLLAKTIWGEARGIDSEREQAAVAWCVLNRVDSDRFPDTIIENVAADAQFNGYSKNNPVMGQFYSIAEDVYQRWTREKNGAGSAGRVLPAEYCYFVGDGDRNYFSTSVAYDERWNWRTRDPYPEIRRRRMLAYEPSEDELEMIAQVIYRTARGVKAKKEKAAVAWIIFNRVSSCLYPDTVREVIEQPGQFPDDIEKTPVRKEYLALARDVWRRWDAEQSGEEDVGRVLPAEYLYIRGNGKKNTFIKKTAKEYAWNWKLPDPYAAEEAKAEAEKKAAEDAKTTGKTNTDGTGSRT